MRIAIVLTPPTDQHFAWAAQVGVTDFVSRYHGIDSLDGLKQVRDRAASFGLGLSVVEGYLPLDCIVHGTSGRDEQIAEISQLIVNMGRLEIPVLCYNFMPRADMTRTAFNVPDRGGALTNSFDAALVRNEHDPRVPALAADVLWENLDYFLKRMLPVAEDAGVVLAMHPDDPPLPNLCGDAQIMFEPASFDRLFEMAPSAANAMCYCQGTFAEMGVDIPATIRHFGERIKYVHFRDVNGAVPRFQETFHDNGKTDMFAAMQAYRDIGFKGVMRPDHVPTMDGEDGDGSGYSMLGRLFAVGYMRGLMHAVGVK